MDKFMSWLESSFAPKMNKIVQNEWILTIKNSVMQILPLIFLGSLFCLLTIPGNYIANWPNFWTPYGWTFGIVSLFVAFLIPYNLLNYKDHKRSAVNGGIAGVILFLISLNPQFSSDLTAMIKAGEASWSKIPDIGGFGAGGMFLAIIAGLIAGAVMNKFAGFSFFKEDSVIPDFVKDWFNSMLPLGIVTIGGWILTDPSFLNLNLYQLVVDLFMPLTNVAGSPFGFVLIMFLYCFLYSMGISTWVLTPIVTPLTLANAQANTALVEAGKATVQNLSIFTDAFIYSGYLWIGGIGCTLALVLMMAFRAKSSELKALGRACIAPAIFNINEPCVFGVVAWNPIMMVPMWLQGIILPIVAYLFTKVIPLGAIPGKLFNMWYCPFPLATWITCGTVGSLLLVLIIFAISWVIWTPFFRIHDKALAEQEQKESESSDEDDDDWSF
ncbi:MAG: PTS transporter subunit EIIC [Olsenella sp.]|jgi:PTS system cellobiose-specific IIC component|nr:PTS transporter subunit EIIC [Olsenella sp.]